MNLISSSLLNLKAISFIKPIVADIYRHNGFLFLVGGAVRDCFLGTSPTDYDIEVYGISFDLLIEIISRYSTISKRHDHYGTFTTPLHKIDWSLPRVDGIGSYPSIIINPFLSIEEALMRRDLTINSIAIEIKADYSLVVHDPFNGISDCQKLIARATNNDFFTHDSMRFFRLLKYIGRYNLTVDEQLQEIALHMPCTDFSIKKRKLLIEKILQHAFYKIPVIEFLNHSVQKELHI